jgi:hypothetical protein
MFLDKASFVCIWVHGFFFDLKRLKLGLILIQPRNNAFFNFFLYHLVYTFILSSLIES